MRKPDMNRNDVGSTMIELVIASVVFTTGMVAVLGGMSSAQTQNRYSEDRARAVNYSMSQMEALRGLSVTAVMNYVVPYDNVQAQTVNIPGAGPCTVVLNAVIPGAGGAAPTYIALGSSAAASYPTASVPNPLEVQAVITPSGPGTHASFKVTTKLVF